MELPLFLQLAVLGTSRLATAHLEKDLLRLHRQGFGQGVHGLFKALLGHICIDGIGRLVLLNMHPGTVKIDGYGILGHIGIVETVTRYVVLFGPAANLAQILLNAVGKHYSPVA